jgi:hypothetical protein
MSLFFTNSKIKIISNAIDEVMLKDKELLF